MKLGELLRTQKLITEAELEHALEIQGQHRTNEKLGEILLKLGYVSEEKLLSVIALQRGFPMLRLGYPLAPDIVSLVPKEICLKYSLVPIDRFGKHLLVAMADPLNKAARNQLAALNLNGMKFKYVLATKEDIVRAINLYYPRSIHTLEENEVHTLGGNDHPAVLGALQVHVQRMSDALQRFSELRQQFRQEAPAHD